MKKIVYILTFLLLSSPFLYAQKTAKADTIRPDKGNVDKQLDKIKERKTELHSDSTGNQPLKSPLIDKKVYNRYGDILLDDPEYNKRYPLWMPICDVLGILTFTWSVDRFISNADYARIGLSTWKYNTYKGVYRWEWDNDRFGVNFVGHPYSGALAFNAGRTTGYNFYQSTGFSVFGSLMWEYFGENTRPAKNDLINTTLSGAFLGEILYRLSSNVLDDRTNGSDRVFREIAAGLIDPVRGVNRLLQGKTFRTTNKEVYEKEPLNFSFYAGIHRINDVSQGIFGKGADNAMFNIQLDYGNPFEERSRKPYDFFKLRADVDFGVGRKYVDNVTGYGILLGKNLQLGNMSMLIGGYQYYDYWDSKLFELGTIGFGGGEISKLPLSSKTNLYTSIHLALIPLAGNSTRSVTDTSQFRDYVFGNGFEGMFESTLNLGKYVDASLIYYYYMIHTTVGTPGNDYISILKPRIVVRLYKDLRIGYEYYKYFNDRYLSYYSALHSVRTEQKIFLLLYLEDTQRRGHYE